MAHHLLPGDPAERSLVMLIRYWDEYALTADGWRFTSRCAEQCWQEIHAASRSGLEEPERGGPSADRALAGTVWRCPAD